MTRRSEQSLCKPTKTYTDGPTRVSIAPGGLIDVEEGRSFLAHWSTTHLSNPEAETCLSVRWAYNGPRFFENSTGRWAVDDDSYLLFNNGQRFSSTIEAETPIECYTVALAPCLAGEVFRSLVTPADHLLDAPKADICQPVSFVEKTYRHDNTVSPLLFRLQRFKDSEMATHGWFEEQFHLLLVGLLHAHRNVHCEIERMPAIRASTRAELYRRLHLARDYMEASLQEPLTLTRVAEVAWFSPHHFLRLFKQVFGATPHQYLTYRRIERAKQLLLRTDVPVTDICFDVGFESLGSFSWLFRRRVGVAPDAFRRRSQIKAFQVSR